MTDGSNRKVIGICGYKGHGKSTVARILEEKYGYKELTFAESLKTSMSDTFHWDRKRLDSTEPEDRIWKETVDPWWSKKLNKPLMSPRWTLQNVGTDIMRNLFSPDIWVASLEKKIIDLPESVQCIAISDCRFNNEKEMIDSLNGIVIRISRASIPMTDCHITEKEFLSFQGPNVIDLGNDGTIEELEFKLEKIVNLFV